VGGLNIDECRVTASDQDELTKSREQFALSDIHTKTNNDGRFLASDKIIPNMTPGRFPANIIHDGSEEVVDGFPYTITSERNASQNKKTEHTNTYTPNQSMYSNQNTYGDEGSASRFFYTAKASKKDRDDGLRGFATGKVGHGNLGNSKGMERFDTVGRNIHPTVKPTDLMQYLIRLIAPKGATVLDLFMGSGSTGKAAMIENVERDANYHFIGIDRTEEYMPIAEARIEFGLHYLAEKPKADGLVHTDQIDLFSLL
jgi:site-specific DNA-methyltransferase (adenine-specific)